MKIKDGAAVDPDSGSRITHLSTSRNNKESFDCLKDSKIRVMCLKIRKTAESLPLFLVSSISCVEQIPIIKCNYANLIMAENGPSSEHDKSLSLSLLSCFNEFRDFLFAFLVGVRVYGSDWNYLRWQ